MTLDATHQLVVTCALDHETEFPGEGNRPQTLHDAARILLSCADRPLRADEIQPVESVGQPPTYEQALQIVRDFNEMNRPGDKAQHDEYFRGQLALLADLFPHPRPETDTETRIEEIKADLQSDKGRPLWVVGLTDPPTRLRRFYSEREAVEFVGTLEGVENGIYYIDPPTSEDE